ncbi:MAG: hypothetical protein DIJKHBIC_04351 [Thermoanaerobaculia bacterium]|nr:hypothetical protein [Thermoanaerobaculia bacterium]
MIVIDANVVAYLLISGPRTAEAEATLLRDPAWVAPVLWKSEVRNVLSLYVRRREIDVETAVGLFERAASIVTCPSEEASTADILRISAERSISAYDAEYAALSSLHGIPLVTADGPLATKCPDLAIRLGDFARDGNPGR